MKKTLSVLLIALLCALIVFPVNVCAAETESAQSVASNGTTGDCTWTLDDDGTLMISGSGKMADYRYSAYFPYAPWGTNVTKVIIKSGVMNVGNCAFVNCAGLTSVTIADSVTGIGDRAFYNCASLSSVTIPKGVKTIGYAAFSSCDILASVLFAGRVTDIGASAFYDCTKLSSIDVPDSVTSIGEQAFYNTSWYNNLPYGLIYINKVAYEYKGTCFDPVVIFEEGTVSISPYAFNNCENIYYISFPDSLISIGKNAFYHNTNLESVSIPDSVKTIGENAFCFCEKLRRVEIGSGVTFIGSGAFDQCGSLSEVYINDLAAWCGIDFGDNPLNGCRLYLNHSLVRDLVIPEGVTAINSSAFAGCTSLTSVTIPEGVTEICASAFENCKGITSVTLPDSLTSVSREAFLSCTAVKSILIPKKVTSIGEHSFGYEYSSGYKKIAGFTIYGYEGSAAQTYAGENGFTFVALKPVAKLLGDANLDNIIDVRDVTVIQRHISDYEYMNEEQFLAADTNQDGIITVEDATLLQRYLAEYDMQLG